MKLYKLDMHLRDARILIEELREERAENEKKRHIAPRNKHTLAVLGIEILKWLKLLKHLSAPTTQPRKAVSEMAKFKDIVLGLADRVDIAEDLNTGERKVKYHVIKEFSGKSKVKNIYQWFDLSSHKRLAVVAPEGVYKDAQSLRGTFSFELWKGTASYNYMTAYAKYGIVYLEKLGGKAK